ncbi:unnamed protein product [Microthlaspi erraticum]|uniref:F-box associated beta-propeller type 1 domain-containing protein n=1 Tax=Microthlaspi erraticum TaxID=1685480 RepID=A0A6D2L0F9_9BRAS|nr:unnamed protein product [Microthlaspi erraticum]
MTMEMSGDLPRDLVVEEILTRVPATDDLIEMGTTCKLWNHMFTRDGRFARKHTDKAAKQFLVLLLRRESTISRTIVDLDGKVASLEVKAEVSLVDPKYPADQFDIKRVFHCDGLLLCTSFDESRFVVWNPFTGETRWFLPSYRYIKDRHFALGYYKEGNHKSYKVLSFYPYSKDFEMYEFGSDSWRVVDDIMAPGWKLGYCSVDVSLKGSTYWFAEDKTKTQSIVSLVKFDYSTEKCVPVPLPYQRSRYDVIGLSVVKDEKLSVLLQLEYTSKTEIWVTSKIGETNKGVSWSKVLAFDMTPDFRLCYEARFLLDDEKKVVMIAVNWVDFEDETKARDMVYIIGEDNEATLVDVGPSIEDEFRADIFNYCPSLVQIQRAGGKRKRADM